MSNHIRPQLSKKHIKDKRLTIQYYLIILQLVNIYRKKENNITILFALSHPKCWKSFGFISDLLFLDRNMTVMEN